MDKYTELEKQAQKFLDETDTMQFSTVELLTMFYEHQKQLTLTDVVVPKGTLSNLDEAIEKAKPNMDKIKDVDKHLDSIR